MERSNSYMEEKCRQTYPSPEGIIIIKGHLPRSSSATESIADSSSRNAISDMFIAVYWYGIVAVSSLLPINLQDINMFMWGDGHHWKWEMSSHAILTQFQLPFLRFATHFPAFCTLWHDKNTKSRQKGGLLSTDHVIDWENTIQALSKLKADGVRPGMEVFSS